MFKKYLLNPNNIERIKREEIKKTNKFYRSQAKGVIERKNQELKRLQKLRISETNYINKKFSNILKEFKKGKEL